MSIKIAHIINPFESPDGSEHAVAQPITFESIKNAVKETSLAKIELYAAIEKEEKNNVPDCFHLLYLDRNLTNVASFQKARRLPLIADIIKLLELNSTADYFIYSNIDIALQPDFYDRISRCIMKGYDSIIVNRRGISLKFNSVEQLNEMYLEEGTYHPGYDCFVFKRELSSKFIFNNICIGIPRFERVFVFNLIAFSNNPLYIENEKLTFHIGETILKNWGDKNHLTHNQKEYEKIKKELLPLLSITKFPYRNLNFIQRYWKWLWNPNFSLTDNLKLDWRFRMKGY